MGCSQGHKSCHFFPKEWHCCGYHSYCFLVPLPGLALCRESHKLNFGPCYNMGGKINYGFWQRRLFFIIIFKAAKVILQRFYSFAFEWEQKGPADSAGISSMYLKSAISYYFG